MSSSFLFNRMWDIDFRSEGVFLTVFPAFQDGMTLNPEEIIKDLMNRKLADIDLAKVRKATHDMNGEQVLIAPPQKEKIIDATVNIETSLNKMEACLTITPPIGGRSVEKDDILEALKQAGVTHGIMDEIIDMAVTMQDVSQPLVVARGINPENGSDAVLSFKFGMGRTDGRPVELDDGRVDYYNLDLIKNVEAGEILVEKIPATAGVPGKNVLGEETPAKPGKDAKLVAGKNTELINDNLAIAATINGHVVVTGNKVNVSSVYEIKGDVDFSTGNITFNGSVLINGSIREGFQVVAQGDVIVANTISGGTVICTGNVKASKGIIGANKTKVKASGSVAAKFIENSVIEADGDVTVGEGIMHSKVNAKGSVIVGGKGVIVGGTIMAAEDIRCRFAGSNMGTLTDLEVGINPELRQAYAKLLSEKQLKDLNYDKAAKAVDVLSALKRTQPDMHPDKRALLVQVTRAQAQLSEELIQINESLEELWDVIQKSERGRVLVKDNLYSGVKVTIGSVSMHIRDDCSFVCLRKSKEGEIVISSYK